MNRQAFQLTLFFIIVIMGNTFVYAQQNYIRTYTYTDESALNEQARVLSVYYDGLGRQRLKVEHSAGCNGLDNSIFVTYDKRGNIEKQWLPVPGGAELYSPSAFASVSKCFYGSDEIAYTSFMYHFTRLNHIERLSSPGILWKNHNTKYSLVKNQAEGEYSCSKLKIDLYDKVYISGCYASGTLEIEETKDADGFRILCFKDIDERIVLRRAIGIDGITADTRFIYDSRGNLRYIISPEGSLLLPSVGLVSDDIINTYAQCFNYDLWHRRISTKLPGCAPTEYVYDKIGNVIFSSTGVDRSNNTWTLTKYDKQLRPAIRGTVSLPGHTRETLQLLYKDSLLIESVLQYDDVESSLMYSNNSGPIHFEPYISWLYDDYKFLVGEMAWQKNNFETSDSDHYTPNSLCTGCITKNQNNGLSYIHLYKYDHNKRLTRYDSWDYWQQEKRYSITYEYDFAGNEIKRDENIEIVVEKQIIETHEAITTNTYDKNGHLLNSNLKIDGKPPVLIRSLVYDSIGRPVADNAGVGIRYRYDIQSHLVGIDSPLFSQAIWYGKGLNVNSSPSYKYINATHSSWKEEKYSHYESYSYDSHGHLLGSCTDNNLICEEFDVNLDASVVGIKRTYRGDIVQDFTIANSEKLIVSLRDVSTPYWSESVGRFPSGDFTLLYDISGRLISDSSREIASISYHKHGSFPYSVKMSDGSISTSDYLPDGSLIKRTFSNRIINTVLRIDANGDTIKKERPTIKTTSHFYYGNFEMCSGKWRYNLPNGHYDLANNTYYWHIHDFLGSTMVITDALGNVYQNTGYFPSGTPYSLPIGNLYKSFDEASDRLHLGNRWLGFKALDWYDNTARIHDPLLARFTTTDPLYEKYPYASPWSHCLSNPINIVDPNGLDNWILDNKGYIISHEESTDYDTFSLADDHGNINEENILRLPYGTLLKFYASTDSYGRPYDCYKLRGDNSSSLLFEFLSQRINIEFSQSKLGLTGDSGLNYITTSHVENSETGMANLITNQLRYGYTIRELIHSHPGNTPYPSGIINENSGDIFFAKTIEKYITPKPVFKIFIPQNLTYIPYSGSSTPEDFGFSSSMFGKHNYPR